jgi:alpha-mannosidase
MSHFTEFARRFTNEYSIPITTAAVSDVPGFTWGIVPALAQSGVRYFASAPNTGDRIGYVLERWGDKPFYWKSQSGNEKVLFWVAGSGYSSFHEGTLSKLGTEKIMKLLRRLDETRYPYDIYYLPYTLGDNGSPDPDLSQFVKSWNEKYVSPRLIIATHRQMFEEFERRYGSRLPEFEGDFTPYWEDGAASTAYETARNRRVVDRLMQGEALWSMGRPEAYPESLYYNAWRNVVLWDEHTWGADKSVSDPDDPGTVGQWKLKQKYVVDSDSLSGLLLNAATRQSNSAGKEHVFDVYNTSNWTRSDIVLLSREQSNDRDLVVDEEGSSIASQRLSTGELALLVTDIPPFSAKRYYAQKGRAHSKGKVSISGYVLQNEFLSVALDPKTGTIASLKSKKERRELVEAGKGLNQYVYVPGTNADSALHLTNVQIRVKERGKVFSSFLVTGDAPGCRGFSSEVRLISGLKRLEIINRVDKIGVRQKEGMHFAYPFRVPGGRIRYDVADGIVEPEKDQLSGSCKNFFSIQHWIDVSNDQLGVSLVTLDAPLIEIGSITAESPWIESLHPSPTLYSYVMNNYWHTNYKADQEGVVTFRYSIIPHEEARLAETSRLSREICQPLLLMSADRSQHPLSSLFTLQPDSIIVESLKPIDHGKSWLVYLYNPTGALQRITLAWNRPKSVTINESNASAVAGAEISTGFGLEPFGTRYVRVSISNK